MQTQIMSKTAQPNLAQPTDSPPGASSASDLGGPLLDAVCALVIVLDPEGRIRHINRNALEAVGLTEDSIVGARWTDCLIESDPQDAANLDHLCQLTAKGIPARFEADLRTPGTTPTRIAWSCKPLDHPEGRLRVLTGIDVTSRRETQRQLVESEEEHRTVLHNISDAVFITDDTGKFTYICPNVAVIFGYDYDDVRQLGHIDRLLGTDWFDPAELQKTGEIVNHELQIRDRSGETHELLVNVKRVAIRRGTRLYTCRDVTRRKEAEARLRQHETELAHVARVSTIGEIAAGLAHQLNQPLAAIAGYARTSLRRLRSPGHDPDKTTALMEKTAQQAERAGDIVRHWHRLLRKEPPPYQEASLNDIVQSALSLLSHEFTRCDIRIDTDLAPQLPDATVNPIEIEQVILNLLRNAIDAVRDLPPAQRSITVQTQRTTPTRICARITDTGPGLAPDHAENLFRPFYSTKPSGLGLGLAIANRIAHAHAATIEAQSNNTQGATFALTLPINGGLDQ